MNSLSKIIENLKLNDDVDSVFITGSFGVKEAKPYSDIDLVVILKENTNNLYSLCRWTDNIFTDIFFFDLSDLHRIDSSKNIDREIVDNVFINWLKEADIKFDKSRMLSALKTKTAQEKNFPTPIKEKQTFWQKINYNLVTNKRYFESNDPLYHKALELRLLYSVIEAICGYFVFRDILWEGEKRAIQRLKNDFPDFYKLLEEYLGTLSLEDRFNLYSQMVDLVFTDDFKKWSSEDQIVIAKDFSILDQNDLRANYARSLFEY